MTRFSLTAATLEQAVGVLLTPGGSKLIRSHTETPLAAKPGELLFAGDGLRTQSAPASFLFCPDRVIETLSPAGEIQLESKRLRLKLGRTSQRPAATCELPKVLQVSIASQQHYGIAMTRGSPSDFPPVPRDQLAPDVLAELEPIEAALRRDPNDAAALISAANLFDRRKLYANELAQFYQMRKQWPDAAWLKAKVFELESKLADELAAADRASKAGGKTFALVVGISKYQKPELNLQFAHADAIDFSRLLRTPRAGPVLGENILLLTDAKATTAAIRNGFVDFLKRRAGKADTVVILIAGHGRVEPQGDRGAYIVTYDSDPEDLPDTALQIQELQKLFQDQLQNVGRVIILIDVCKAGAVGVLKGKNSINRQIEQQLGDAEGSLTGILAAGPAEFSFEGPEYGGGHGAFSYFVIKGMEGEADVEGNRDGIVDARELYDFVYRRVEQGTGGKQHPREFGSFENQLRLVDLHKSDTPVSSALHDYRFGGDLLLAGQVPSLSNQAEIDVQRFRDAVEAQPRRLLPGEPASAFDALDRLRTELPPDALFKYENELRVALEDEAQKIILRYLEGDQIPQARQDFDLGSRYMSAARRLTRESLYLESRESFFSGRTLLFDQSFPAATGLLENAVRLDPSAGYAYNALGIGYLEQANFSNAIHAFRDASRNAPYWAYPLHNLALAYTQIGDYTAAIAAYRQAMQLAPRYAYLPHNLGLLYQRLNKFREAEQAYRKALELAPDLADTYNALGYLRESQGHSMDAEKLYTQALQINPELLAARQNLAVLIFRQRDRANEAIALWRLNLNKQPDYLPSRLSLAKALSAQAQNDQAIVEYLAAVQSRPDYIVARLALVDLYEQKQDFESALQQLNQALQVQPSNPLLLERLGDLETSLGRKDEAAKAYQQVLSSNIDREVRKRVRSKIAHLRP